MHHTPACHPPQALRSVPRRRSACRTDPWPRLQRHKIQGSVCTSALDMGVE
jgi:hypothetical protein